LPAHEDEAGLTTDIAEDGRLIGFEVLSVVAMSDLERFTNLPGRAREAIRALGAGSNTGTSMTAAG
jgi:hypothetical protein